MMCGVCSTRDLFQLDMCVLRHMCVVNRRIKTEEEEEEVVGGAYASHHTIQTIHSIFTRYLSRHLLMELDG